MTRIWASAVAAALIAVAGCAPPSRCQRVRTAEACLREANRATPSADADTKEYARGLQQTSQALLAACQAGSEVGCRRYVVIAAATGELDETGMWAWSRVVDAAFKRAASTRRIEALEAFAKEFSGSRRAAEAKRRVVSLRLDAALRECNSKVTLGPLVEFLVDHPRETALVEVRAQAVDVGKIALGELRERTRWAKGTGGLPALTRRLEETTVRAAFDEAERIGTEAAWSAFRQEYPKDARASVAFEREAQVVWNGLDQNRRQDLRALAALVTRYRGSKAAGEATSAASAAMSLQVAALDDVLVILAFFRAFPGAEVPVARKRAATLLKNGASSLQREPYERFLAAFPTAPEVAEVRTALQRRDQIEEERERKRLQEVEKSCVRACTATGKSCYRECGGDRDCKADCRADFERCKSEC